MTAFELKKMLETVPDQAVVVIRSGGRMDRLESASARQCYVLDDKRGNYHFPKSAIQSDKEIPVPAVLVD